jgi:YidC/Oxa1 family membrane protein insertase
MARTMKYMPYLFLFVFASMPAGLVLYWTWSNILSIIQQHIITKRHEAAKLKKASKALAS